MTTHETKESRDNQQATDRKSVAIAINRRQLLTAIFLICVVTIIGLMVGDWVVNYAHGIDSAPIRRLFNITREDGLASMLAVSLTMFAALTMWVLWWMGRVSGAAKHIRRGWLILAGFFTYLAIDDGAMIHERLGTALDEAVSGGWLTGFPSYYWQIIFLPILGVFGVYFLYFLMRQLTSSSQKKAIIVALTCLALAIILDFFEGLSPGSSLNIYTGIANNLDFADYTYRTFGASEYDTLVHFSKSIEESLEMLAMSLIWVTMMAHLMDSYPKVSITAR